MKKADDFSHFLEDKKAQHCPGTRDWLFDEVRSWLYSQASATRAFWLVGQAGSGKSVTSAKLLDVEGIKEHIVAWHFCRQNEVASSDVRAILQSWAAMFTMHVPGFTVSEAEWTQAIVGSVEQMFEGLIATPMRRATAPTTAKLIVVDGLDELPVATLGAVLILLVGIVQALPSFVRLLITSRDHAIVSSKLEKLAHVRVSLDPQQDSRNRGDLRVFLTEIARRYVDLTTYTCGDLETRLEQLLGLRLGQLHGKLGVVDSFLRQAREIYDAVTSKLKTEASFEEVCKFTAESIPQNRVQNIQQSEGKLDELIANATIAREVMLGMLAEGWVEWRQVDHGKTTLRVPTKGKTTWAENIIDPGLKTREAVARKVREVYNGNPQNIKDFVRFTAELSSCAKMEQAMQQLLGSSPSSSSSSSSSSASSSPSSSPSMFQVVNVHNKYACPSILGYRDITLHVRVNGHFCELQLNVHSMLQARELVNSLYEKVQESFSSICRDAGIKEVAKFDYVLTRLLRSSVLKEAVEELATKSENLFLNATLLAHELDSSYHHHHHYSSQVKADLFKLRGLPTGLSDICQAHCDRVAVSSWPNLRNAIATIFAARQPLPTAFARKVATRQTKQNAKFKSKFRAFFHSKDKGDDKNAIISGVLLLQIDKNWASRHVTLTPTSLQCSQKIDGTGPISQQLLIPQNTKITRLPAQDELSCIFRVATEQEQWTLSAANEDELQRWMNEIQARIPNASQQTLAPSALTPTSSSPPPRPPSPLLLHSSSSSPLGIPAPHVVGSYAFNRSKEGWLKKLGQKIKSWKLRYFVLSDSIMYYFKDPFDASQQGMAKGLRPLGSFSCLHAIIAKEFNIHTGFSVTPAGNKRKYILVGSSENDVENWISTIKACSALQPTTMDPMELSLALMFPIHHACFHPLHPAVSKWLRDSHKQNLKYYVSPQDVMEAHKSLGPELLSWCLDCLDSPNGSLDNESRFAVTDAVYHLTQSGSFAEAYELLGNFEWLLLRASWDCRSLVEDAERFAMCDSPYQSTGRLLANALRFALPALLTDYHSLAGQLVGRLMCYEEKNEDIRNLLKSVRAWPGPDNSGWWCPSLQTFVPAGNPLRAEFKQFEDASSVAWSPDNKLLAVACGTEIRLWEVIRERCVQVLMGNQQVRSVAWSYDGTKIASGAEDCLVRIWDWESGKCFQQLQGHTDQVNSVSWSDDDVYVCSGGRDKEVRTWNVVTGDCLMVFKGHTAAVSSVKWSSDGIKICSGGDHRVRIFRADGSYKGQKDLSIGNAYSGTTLPVAWSPDGKRIACGGIDTELCLWDVADGARTNFLGHTQKVLDVCWSPDGLRVCSASLDQTLRVWDVRSGACVQTFVGHTGAVKSVAWSNDGMSICSAGDQSVIVWTVASGSAQQAPIETKRTNDEITSLSWSSDGRLCSASRDATLRVWHVESGRRLQTLSGCKTSSCVVWSSDGRIACGDSEGTVRVWDPVNLNVQLMFGHIGAVGAVAWGSDGKLCSGGFDNSVRIWNAEAKECEQVFVGHSDRITSLAWSADSSRVCSSGGSELRVWEVSSGKCVWTLPHPAGIVTSGWSSDNRVFCKMDNRKVRVWELAQGTCLYEKETLASYPGASFWIGCWLQAASILPLSGYDTTAKGLGDNVAWLVCPTNSQRALAVTENVIHFFHRTGTYENKQGLLVGPGANGTCKQCNHPFALDTQVASPWRVTRFNSGKMPRLRIVNLATHIGVEVCKKAVFYFQDLSGKQFSCPVNGDDRGLSPHHWDNDNNGVDLKEVPSCFNNFVLRVTSRDSPMNPTTLVEAVDVVKICHRQWNHYITLSATDLTYGRAKLVTGKRESSPAPVSRQSSMSRPLSQTAITITPPQSPKSKKERKPLFKFRSFFGRKKAASAEGVPPAAPRSPVNDKASLTRTSGILPVGGTEEDSKSAAWKICSTARSLSVVHRVSKLGVQLFHGDAKNPFAVRFQNSFAKQFLWYDNGSCMPETWDELGQEVAVAPAQFGDFTIRFASTGLVFSHPNHSDFILNAASLCYANHQITAYAVVDVVVGALECSQSAEEISYQCKTCGNSFCSACMQTWRTRYRGNCGFCVATWFATCSHVHPATISSLPKA